MNNSGYYAIAIQFEDVGSGTPREIAIKDLLTCNAPKGRGDLHDWADQIHVWTGGSWQKFFYHTSGVWYEENGIEETQKTVKSGDTVFFRRSDRGNKSGDTITISGAISLTTPQVVTSLANSTYYFVSYPWPVKFAIADFKNCVNDNKGRTSLHDWADQVHRWNGAGWTKYFYNSTAGIEGYCIESDTTKVTDHCLNVGEGVFFRRSDRGNKSGDTLTFTKPAGL